MGITAQIDKIKCVIDKGIGDLFVNRKPESLYRPMYHLLDGGGKRIRPILLVLSCQVVGGKIEDCLDAALAVEILHTFTLVHDDIMDHDDMRRGKTTVHKKWDEPTAILAGDGLVTLAYQILLKSKKSAMIPILRRFTDGLMVLCEGQAFDKTFETQKNVTLEAYEQMIEKKTAKLIEVSCEIGAMLGMAGTHERESLMLFGHYLGKAFQVQDDILDIMSDESISGKPLGSDIVEKKKTYLTIHFLKNGSPESKRIYQQLQRQYTLGRKDILQIRELFRQAGSFRVAQKLIETLNGKALACLNGLERSQARDDLKSLTLFIQNRIH